MARQRCSKRRANSSHPMKVKAGKERVWSLPLECRVGVAEVSVAVGVVGAPWRVIGVNIVAIFLLLSCFVVWCGVYGKVVVLFYEGPVVINAIISSFLSCLAEEIEEIKRQGILKERTQIYMPSGLPFRYIYLLSFHLLFPFRFVWSLRLGKQTSKHKFGQTPSKQMQKATEEERCLA